MRLSRLLAAFSSPLLPVLALAGLPSVAVAADVDRHFADYYYSSEIDPRFCGRNVDGFIDHLKKNHALPGDLRRVVIRAPNPSWHPGYMMIAMNSRFATPRPNEPRMEFYSFHVVALWRGKIYDFSFDQEPRALPAAEYFEAMFVPTEPYPIFGRDFRIRGKGPNYGADDARAEMEAFAFEVERPTVGGRTETEAEFENLSAFLEKVAL